MKDAKIMTHHNADIHPIHPIGRINFVYDSFLSTFFIFEASCVL